MLIAELRDEFFIFFRRKAEVSDQLGNAYLGLAISIATEYPQYLESSIGSDGLLVECDL